MLVPWNHLTPVLPIFSCFFLVFMCSLHNSILPSLPRPPIDLHGGYLYVWYRVDTTASLPVYISLLLSFLNYFRMGRRWCDDKAGGRGHWGRGIPLSNRGLIAVKKLLLIMKLLLWYYPRKYYSEFEAGQICTVGSSSCLSLLKYVHVLDGRKGPPTPQIMTYDNCPYYSRNSFAQ